MKTFLFIYILIAFFPSSKEGYTRLSSSNFYERITTDTTGIILDVRLYEDYRESRIMDAVWVGKKEVLTEVLKSVDKEQNIYLYCYEGKARGKAVIKIMLEMEYKNIFFLDEGFNGWVKRGFETDRTKISKISHFSEGR